MIVGNALEKYLKGVVCCTGLTFDFVCVYLPQTGGIDGDLFGL